MIKSVKLKHLVKNKDDYELLQRITKHLFTKTIKEVDGTLTIPVIMVQELEEIIGSNYFEELQKDLNY